MDVLVLIDKLDDLVHNAKPVPLTDQDRWDKEEIYDILDQMRATIPEEIKQARWIVKERQEMLAEAKREAEPIVKEARERQEQLVSQQEVTRQAERAAEDIIEDARAREREVRWRDAPVDGVVRRHFGYMPEERGLYPKMRVRAQLTYLAALHGVDTPEAAADRWIERLGLAERADDRVEALSLGNQQRVQLA